MRHAEAAVKAAEPKFLMSFPTNATQPKLTLMIMVVTLSAVYLCSTDRTHTVRHRQVSLVKLYETHALFVWLISHQYFSLRTNQQPVSSTFLSEQTSTSHQPPANRTSWQSRKFPGTFHPSSSTKSIEIHRFFSLGGSGGARHQNQLNQPY
jgi:hypothetical protein